MSADGFICGVSRGKRKRFRCGCCGYESDNPESFAMSTCWPCSGIGGGNLDCANCRDLGVFVDRFSAKGTKGHRMKAWEKGKRAVLTVCGQRIPKDDIGQANAVREECARCWPTQESERS